MCKRVIAILTIMMTLLSNVLTPYSYVMASGTDSSVGGNNNGGTEVVVEDVNVTDLGGNKSTQEFDKESELVEAWETLNKEPLEKGIRHKRVIIRVKAKAESFPEGTEIEITPVLGEEYEQVKQQITDTQENIDESVEMVAVDIKFLYTLSNGEKVELQPKDENSVTVSFDYSRNSELKEAEASEEQEIQIYHINDKDENGEKVEEGEEVVEKIEINEEKSEDINNGVVIDAESFSYYTIVVQRREEAPESNPTQTWQYGEDYFTINIARPSSLDNNEDYANHPGITIMDRNLGATATGYGDSNTASTDSYGYLYQWGNNYGFPYSAASGDILTGIGLQRDDSYNDMGYVSKRFIEGSNYDKDVWNNSGHYDDIWGGTGDNADNRWGAKLTNYADRQGPCPEGWHVPSAGEWGLLIKYWALASGTNDVLGSSGLFYLQSDYSAFQEYFKLPFAGGRNSSTADLKAQGSYGYYWSSSPYSAGSSSARTLDLDSSYVDADYINGRAYGLSVRCFKDSYVASPETSNLVDTQAWVEGKDFETITISNPENSNEGFTIMDRNLGAEDAVISTTANTIANTGSYGFKYQWGNNYGFEDGCWTNECSDYVTTGGYTTTLATGNNIYNNHGYFGNKFIKGSTDYWQSSLHYDNLRGGAGDVNFSGTQNTVNKLYWDDGGDRSLRQGPCPMGYHVPSAGEWSMLVYYWYKKNYNKTPSINNNLYYFSNDTSREAFMTFFKLPFAGFRNYSTADLKYQGSDGYYWSSSPLSAGSNIRPLPPPEFVLRRRE